MPMILLHFSKLQKLSFARPWRAPEIYINPSQYTEKLDIWSVGCIMGELILLHPVFCGATQTDLLHNIFDIIGTPDITTLNKISIPEGWYIKMTLRHN